MTPVNLFVVTLQTSRLFCLLAQDPNLKITYFEHISFGDLHVQFLGPVPLFETLDNNGVLKPQKKTGRA